MIINPNADRFDAIEKGFWREYETYSEHAERIEAGYKIAGKLFDEATVAQRATYVTIVDNLVGDYSPRANRIRDVATLAWYVATKAAAELCLRTFEDCMRDDEPSAATMELWDAMLDAQRAEAA